MLGSPFGPGGESGFKMRHVRRDLLEGTFIERVESIESIEDPFGQTQEFRRTEYRQTYFRIGTTTPAIELINPLRTSRAFLERLWEYSGGAIYIEPARARVSDWISKLETEIDNIVVISARLSDLTLSNSVSARIELSGTSDIRRHISAFSKPHSITMDRAEFSCSLGGENYHCEVTNEGKAVVHSGFSPKALLILRASLSATLT